MSFDEEFLDRLVEALGGVQLEAIIVGNVAGLLQGAPVSTRVVELLVCDTPLNRKKLRRLAENLGGVGPEEISPLTSAQRILGTAVPIDILFNEISGGLKFESLRSRSSKILIRRHSATVASLADVIHSKEAAGRPKDLAQLPILRDTLRVRHALEKDDKGTK